MDLLGNSIALNGNLTLNTSKDLTLTADTGAISRTAGTVTARNIVANGATGIGTAGNRLLASAVSLAATAGGNSYFTNTGALEVKASTVNGLLDIITGGTLTVSGAVSAGTAAFNLNSELYDFILGAAGSVTATGAGEALVIRAKDFINNNPAITALNASGSGRYAVYTDLSSGNTLGNLLIASGGSGQQQAGIDFGDDVSGFSGDYFFYSAADGTIRLIPLSQTHTYNGNSQFVTLFGTAYGVNSSDVSTLTTDGYSTTDFNNSLSAGLGFAIDSVALGSADTTNAFSASKDITLTGSLTSSLGYTVALDNSVVGDYLINPKAITAINGITAVNKTYDGLTAASLNTGSASFAGIINGDGLSVATATGAFDNKNAGTGKTVNITGLSLSGADVGNYTLTDTTATTTATIFKASLDLTPNSQSYTYNGTASQFNDADYTLSGFVNGETLGTSGVAGLGLVSASDKINAGTRDITASTGTLNASNYSFIANTLNNGLGIAKADLTIAVDDASRLVGQPNPNFTYLVTGLKGNDGESVINNLNVTTPATSNSPAGSYTITASDATARNYSFVYRNGVLTLLPVAIPARPISSGFKLPDTVAQVSQGVTQGLANNLATAQRNILNNTNFRTQPYTAASIINNTAAATIIPILDTTLPTESSVFSNQGIYLTMHPDLANILGYKGDFIRY